MKQMSILWALTIGLVWGPTLSFADNLSDNGQATASYFKQVKSDPNGLLTFLQSMPKGGDLHNHRSGAAYAENMISAGVGQHFCMDPLSATVKIDKACPSNLRLDNLALANPSVYNQAINAWSMRNFVATPQESAHDHFFNTFLKYLVLSDAVRSQNLTEIVERAGEQNESYLETMISAGEEPSIALGAKLQWTDNFALMQNELTDMGIDKIAQDVSQELNHNEAYLKKTLGCGTTEQRPGCHVTVRYQFIALRVMPPAQVFAQLAMGFDLASRDPRVVAINLVGPEDNYTALRDYDLQMKMLAYFHQRYPQVHIDLHAGELALGFVPPEAMRDHIRQAVEVASAERIGHGVDIAHETQSLALLQEMANKHIAVEICLTSNQTILGVVGNESQLGTYMHYNVPVVLATDDEGVLRTDLTHEMQKAVLTYNLDYPTLKTFVRNSLTYNFMPGQSLWADPQQFIPVTVCTRDNLQSDKLSPDCLRFIDASPKANLQWQLERHWGQFEKQMAATYRAQAAVQ